MKAEHINPFLDSTLNLFENMLGTRPETGEKTIHRNIVSHRWDISGVIGVTGAAIGVIAIRMTYAMVQKLLEKSGVPIDSESENLEMISSMVGEMANIIAGNALGRIKQYDLDISVPIVIQGKNHSVSWPENHPIICIPFRCVQGTFEVNVSLNENLLYGIFPGI